MGLDKTYYLSETIIHNNINYHLLNTKYLSLINNYNQLKQKLSIINNNNNNQNITSTSTSMYATSTSTYDYATSTYNDATSTSTYNDPTSTSTYMPATSTSTSSYDIQTSIYNEKQNIIYNNIQLNKQLNNNKTLILAEKLDLLKYKDFETINNNYNIELLKIKNENINLNEKINDLNKLNELLINEENNYKQIYNQKVSECLCVRVSVCLTVRVDVCMSG